MTGWLTTGQMIDRLKVGQIAELEEKAQIPKQYGMSYNYVTKNRLGDIKWCTKDGNIESTEPLLLYGHTIYWKWRILPTYVSFEEAMKAMREGKIVAYYNGDSKVTAGYNGSMDWVRSFSWKKLIDGRWTIEGDSE